MTSDVNAGAAAGESHVELTLVRCGISENRTSPSGSGMRFNAWDPGLGCRQRNWMDDSGTITTCTDRHFTDGAMRFVANRKEATGRWRKQLPGFLPVGPDQLRRLGERSPDGGRSWVADYDLESRRRK